MTVIAIRAKNPLNIRPLPGGGEWNGQIGVEAPHLGGYCKFGDWAYGIRACAKQLLAYQRKHNKRTIQAIIERWAPKRDNNHVANYVSRVSRLSGYAPDDRLDLEKMDTMDRIFNAMARVEIGISDTAALPYGRDVFLQGLELAGFDVPQDQVRTAPPPAPMSGGQRAGVATGAVLATGLGAAATEAAPMIAAAGDIGKYIAAGVAALLIAAVLWRFVLPRLRS